jgi:hypothetical protein
VLSMGVDGLGEMSDALRLRLGREGSGSTSMGLGGGSVLLSLVWSARFGWADVSRGSVGSRRSGTVGAAA